MTLREFTARENLYEWLETGRCRGLTDKFIAVEAKRTDRNRVLSS